MSGISNLLSTFTSGDAREHPDLPNVWVFDGNVSPLLDSAQACAAIRERMPEPFLEVEAWSNAFRTVWNAPADRAQVTYCEGDVSVAICATDVDWRALQDSCADYYERSAR